MEFMNEEDYFEFSQAIDRIKKKEPTTRKRDVFKKSLTNLYGSIKNLAITEEEEERVKNNFIYIFLYFRA